MTPTIEAVPCPLAVIDYEASSLEDDSYPIEVGIAVWLDVAHPIVVWSSLIRPEREWRLYGHWSRRSQKAHGIRSDDLSTAPDANAVAAELCARLDGVATVWCDGGPYDAYWNGRLFAAAKRVCPFRLGDWHRMLLGLPREVREAIVDRMERVEERHRAGDDAEAMLTALADALGLRPDIIHAPATA